MRWGGSRGLRHERSWDGRSDVLECCHTQGWQLADIPRGAATLGGGAALAYSRFARSGGGRPPAVVAGPRGGQLLHGSWLNAQELRHVLGRDACRHVRTSRARAGGRVYTRELGQGLPQRPAVARPWRQSSCGSRGTHLRRRATAWRRPESHSRSCRSWLLIRRSGVPRWLRPIAWDAVGLVLQHLC